MIIFGAIWAHTPFFGLFYLKSYDDEIWYVGTLCDLEYECPNRISKAPVLLPAEGGFPFGRRPMVLLAVGELFVRARSARSQARSACAIARRRRISIQNILSINIIVFKNNISYDKSIITQLKCMDGLCIFRYKWIENTTLNKSIHDSL